VILKGVKVAGEIASNFPFWFRQCFSQEKRDWIKHCIFVNTYKTADRCVKENKLCMIYSQTSVNSLAPVLLHAMLWPRQPANTSRCEQSTANGKLLNNQVTAIICALHSNKRYPIADQFILTH